MPIHRLSPLLVNQIAAGEVIERPASVVKELVENSLDAGAVRVDVQVAEGGRELIRVADDGAGIDPAELAMAVEPHATSKIAQVTDLEAIHTLGFRGEALASIASVCRLRITSRTRDGEGASIEASADQRSAPRPAAASPGTVVEVRNLFFNTPARRKFMRGAQTEFGHVHDALRRIAMAHPAVGFKLTADKRTAVDLPPGQTAAQRCISLLGADLAEALLEFESNERGVSLWGLAGLPAIARATARHQYIYVNGRPIRDRNVAHAVKEAYRGLIEPAQQPTLVLFISLDPYAVDVNVHPTKAEVRFADSNAVHGQVLSVVRQRLLATDLVPTINVYGGRAPSSAIDPAALSLDGPGGEDADLPSVATASPQTFVDYFRRMDPHQKGFVYEQVRREMTDAAKDELDAAGADSPHLTEPIRPAQASILQVHNSYLVTQDEHGIVIIDQHALHERMMFEKLLARIGASGRLESQRLITPATVAASPQRIEALARIESLLETIGVEAAPIGPNTIGVHAFATLLFDRGVDPAEFIDDLLDKVEAEGLEPSSEAALHEVLDMMSCKAAVKAGDRLQPEELSELLTRRDQIERASNCPHGRPTTIRLSIRDLEKHFKRT